MSRPLKNANLTSRMRAFEMFSTGSSRTEVARELGLTKQTIGNWARQDRWESRLSEVVTLANAAAEHAVGEELAQALAKLKQGVARRIMELELLCGPSARPDTRLRAIQLWMKLAGTDRALPNPTSPGDSRSLELIEDLVRKDL